MLHKLSSAVDLLGARGVALLRLFALPDRDRQELIGAAIEEQVAGDEPFALKALMCCGHSAMAAAAEPGFGLEVITRAYIGQLLSGYSSRETDR